MWRLLGVAQDADPPHLLACLAPVPDPRAGRGRRHPLVAILGLAAAAVLAGARSIAAIAEWAADAPQEVRATLGARRDGPDHASRAVRAQRQVGGAPEEVPAFAVADRTRDRGHGHGRLEVRTLKAVTVGHFGFPHVAQVIQVTRRICDLHASTRRWQTVTVHAITSLPFELARPAWLADLLRGHWTIEAAAPHPRRHLIQLLSTGCNAGGGIGVQGQLSYHGIPRALSGEGTAESAVPRRASARCLQSRSARRSS